MIPIPPPRKAALPPPKARHIIPMQDDMILDCGESLEAKAKRSYSSKIVAPIYKPRGIKPDVFLLVDKSKKAKLIAEIKDSKVTDEEKAFLVAAAGRHNIFNYELIADYYAHSGPEMQRLMEQSALVIIDFEDAIALGYVRYTEEIADLYAKEHAKRSS